MGVGIALGEAELPLAGVGIAPWEGVGKAVGAAFRELVGEG